MILLFLVAWGLVAVAVGVVIGKAIALADARRDAELAGSVRRHPAGGSDATWLDDQPVECLSDAEVARRCERLETWA